MTVRAIKQLQSEMTRYEILGVIMADLEFPDDNEYEKMRNEIDELLFRALDRNEISFRYTEKGILHEDGEFTHIPAIEYISIASLKEWMEKINFKPKFFFPNQDVPKDQHKPEYLDPKHPRYAPKLAAAVQAWLAVTEVRAESPKSALKRWLQENAKDFGILDSRRRAGDGVIDTIASIANWKPEGGVPKTP